METIHMTEKQINEYLLAAGKRYNDAVLSGTGVTISGKHLPLKDFMVTAGEEPSQEPQLSDLEIVQRALIQTGTSLTTDQESWILTDEDNVHCVVESFASNVQLLTWAKQTLGIEGQPCSK